MLKKPQKAVHIMLPLDLYEMLKLYAKDDFRTIPAEIRQILKTYVMFREQDDEHRTKGL